MEKNNLTPEESFTIINKAIAGFKTNYRESASIFLLWGWMLSIASFTHFAILMILKRLEAWDLMGIFSIGNWLVFVLIGFIIQYFMIRRENKNRKVYTYLDTYLKYLWTVSGVSFFIGAFICLKLGILPPPIMLLIAGTATTITGLFIKFRPLMYGGIALLIFSIVTTFVSTEYITLLNGVAIICGYLIPGYYLKSAKI